MLSALGLGPAVNSVQASDWIGLEAPPSTHAGYAYRHDEDGSDSHRVYLSHRPVEAIDLHLDWSQDTLEDNRTRFDSERFDAALEVALTDAVSIGVGYRFEGEPDELEIEQIGLALSYSPLPVSISLEIRQGTLFLFTRDEITNPGVPDRVDSDLDAIYASLGWFADRWSGFLSVEEYDYQRDLSALATRPLLQLLIKPGVLANAGLLLQRQVAVGATQYLASRELSLVYAVDSSAIDDSDSENLSFDWREYHDDFDLVYALGHSLDSAEPWSIGIGFEWHG